MTNSSVSGTILSQLGGQRFVAMTGAHQFLNLGNGLQLKFKGSKTTNCVRVELEIDDTYHVTFYKLKGFDALKVSEYYGVYCDQLSDLFIRNTGLEISL